MGSFGGFYKGDKKKSKKQQNSQNQVVSNAPVFTLPRIVEKKRKGE